MSNNESPELKPGQRTFFHGAWLDRITCKEFVEWATTYLEGKLPEDQRIAFEAHLAECPGCPIYFEQLRQTIRTVGKLSDSLMEVTPTAKRELLSMFAQWKAEKSVKPNA